MFSNPNLLSPRDCPKENDGKLMARENGALRSKFMMKKIHRNRRL